MYCMVAPVLPCLAVDCKQSSANSCVKDLAWLLITCSLKHQQQNIQPSYQHSHDVAKTPIFI